MKVIIRPTALDTIYEIAELIDGINTPGAGDRWVDRLLDFINDYARQNVRYALCQNTDLAEHGLSCITFNNWVIAFRIDRKTFVVHQIIFGVLL